MMYDRKKMFTRAMKATEENSLYFIEDVIAFLPCGKTWFYDNFPLDSEESDAIRANLEQNRVKKKVEIRQRLGESDRATELLPLYRLICTDEERQRLNKEYVETTMKEKPFDPGELTPQERKECLQELRCDLFGVDPGNLEEAQEILQERGLMKEDAAV